ncbi:MAG: site-2 protease family protein, partial [Anaerolineales bacterium]|nr:site-2 protease family protein [Anaerolineales bacterium]
ELGHSFAALYYGVPVTQIVLMPLGGVAQLGRIPEKPVQEFVIAIAGPMVNFVLAGLMFLLSLVISLTTSLDTASLLTVDLSFAAIFNYIFVSNLFLGVFNLLPAFPMDGGRILRALLATRLNYVRATRIAVMIGQGMAWLFGLWGFLGGGLMLILIAFFVYIGAGQEGQAVQLRHVLGNLTVRQAYSRQALTLPPSATLRDAVALTLRSFQADFPICEGEQLLGLLSQSRLLEALNELGPDVPVVQVMRRDIRPVSPAEEIIAVQERMAEENLDALPVVEADRFLGLLTSRDIGELFRLLSTQPDLIRETVRE